MKINQLKYYTRIPLSTNKLNYPIPHRVFIVGFPLSDSHSYEYIGVS